MKKETLGKFKIIDVGEPFDGLIAYADQDEFNTVHALPNGIVSVQRIQSVNKLFPTWSQPINQGTFFLRAKNLLPYEDVEEEELTGNPWGPYRYDFQISKGDIKLFCGVFEHATTVKLMQGERLLYTHNYVDDYNTSLHGFLKSIQADRNYDWDHLVHDLRRHE